MSFIEIRVSQAYFKFIMLRWNGTVGYCSVRRADAEVLFLAGPILLSLLLILLLIYCFYCYLFIVIITITYSTVIIIFF